MRRIVPSWRRWQGIRASGGPSCRDLRNSGSYASPSYRQQLCSNLATRHPFEQGCLERLLVSLGGGYEGELPRIGWRLGGANGPCEGALRRANHSLLHGRVLLVPMKQQRHNNGLIL
mgnify:CR=1 FL=1